MEYKLNKNWDLWYHSIKDNNWDKNSYRKLLTIRNLFDFKIIIDNFKQNHYQNGMFFIMQSGIFPNWEDPKNRIGGCLSFKIYSKDIIETWNYLLINIFNESLFKNNNKIINGISITPKKEFNIIKIWINDKIVEYNDIFIENKYLNINESLFKPNS